MARTKSSAWATRRASHISSSVASGLPYWRLLATVPENRYGFWGTNPIEPHSTSGSSSRTSTPPTSTEPDVASNSRGTKPTRVVLPAPVLPTMAVVVPATVVKEMSRQHRLLGAGVVEADVAQLESPRLGQRRPPGRPGGTTLDGVSSTSWIRSEDTEARGIIDTMNVAITTDHRICTR